MKSWFLYILFAMSIGHSLFAVQVPRENENLEKGFAAYYDDEDDDDHIGNVDQKIF